LNMMGKGNSGGVGPNRGAAFGGSR
jgi:hypothetical protein